MTKPTRPSPSRQAQARLMRLINVPMRALLSLPFPTPVGSRLMLVYLTGRRTGRHYRQPVSYVRHDNSLLTPGGGRWKLNLVDGQAVQIRLRGRNITARPELVRDPDRVEALLEVLVTQNPRSAGFIRIPRDFDGHFDRSALEKALGYGFCIVRWHPADSRAAGVMTSEAITAVLPEL
jgi:deazaflavin-dependent oxidoreductase (nitroreductase family)